MRYSQIRKMDISNGLGVGASLFVQGCHFHCQGCFNKETWDFNGGQQYTKDTKQTIIKLLQQPQFTRFSILGGEPLEECNLRSLLNLIDEIKEQLPHIKIWVYTGYTYENLLARQKGQETTYLGDILAKIDVLVDGQFVQEQKDIAYPFAGSLNQRVIDMNKTREKGEIILLDL